MSTPNYSDTTKLDKELRKFLAEEPAISYKRKPKTFQDFMDDSFALVQSISQGMPYPLFEEIVSLSPYSEEEWADLIGLSYKSMTRYKASNKRFKPIHSEKIFEFAEVFKVGMEFFEDSDKFKHWLERKTIAFGGMRPVDFMKSSYGKDLVVERLVNYEHGIFI